ncbi:MAG: ApaG domain [Opitutales bacterium]
MTKETLELPGLVARVNKLVYRFDPDNAPKGRSHIFIYFITIDNQSAYEVTIMGRRWVLHGRDGRIHVAEGDGVVGENPRIRSGESYSFNSFHIVGGPAMAVGSFHGVDSEGRHILVRIPAFPLQLPGRDA